jgi:hypothetical protein
VTNSAASVYNATAPEGGKIVSYDLELNRWDMESDRDNPNWGKTVRKMSFVVGEEKHPAAVKMQAFLRRQQARKKNAKSKKKTSRKKR